MRYERNILIVTILLLSVICSGQGTDMGRELKPGAFFGITAETINSDLVHTSSFQLINDEASVKSSLSGSVDFGYMVSRAFGIKTAIAFNTYKASLQLDTYTDAFNLKDDENETYELRVTGSDITENESVKSLRIPAGIVLNIPISKIITLFAEPEIGISIPLGTKFSSTGLFTYKGYYPEYNVLLENLPNHKFYTNKAIITDGMLELKKLWTDVSVFGGLGIFVSRKIQLKAGVKYLKSLSGLSDNGTDSKFHLSPSSGEVISLSEKSTAIETRYLGFGVSLRYFIHR